jgi:PTS system mannose-specific IID component
VPTLTGATGNPLGPIIYVALVSIVIVAIGYTAWMQGYSRGRMFITEILKSGAIDRVLIGAGVMGNMVLGALAASFVVVNLAPTVTIAGAQMNLQAAVLDPLFPGALALGLVVMTWWLLRRRISPLALLAVYLVLSIVAAYPFFGPASTTSSDPAAQYQVCTSSLLHPYYACGAPPAPSAQP